MNQRLSYRMHTIDLELMEIRPQRFRWLYMIDGTHFKAGTDVLQPEAIARANALDVAQRQIDALELDSITAMGAFPVRSGADNPTVHGAMLREAAGKLVDRSEEARRRSASRPAGGDSAV